jgi:hypothetical protein
MKLRIEFIIVSEPLGSAAARQDCSMRAALGGNAPDRNGWRQAGRRKKRRARRRLPSLCRAGGGNLCRRGENAAKDF